MIDFVNRVPGDGKTGRKRITYEDGTSVIAFIEYDDEPVVVGTPINRDNMMAVQGFIGMTTEKKDGGILQTNSKGDELFTIKNSNDVITQTFTGKDGTVITKTIRKENGKIIVEVVS